MSIFKLYDYVAQGKRLPLPSNMPEGLKEIIEKCWEDDAESRPKASDVTKMLEEAILKEFDEDCSHRRNKRVEEPSKRSSMLSIGRVASWSFQALSKKGTRDSTSKTKVDTLQSLSDEKTTRRGREESNSSGKSMSTMESSVGRAKEIQVEMPSTLSAAETHETISSPIHSEKSVDDS